MIIILMILRIFKKLFGTIICMLYQCTVNVQDPNIQKRENAEIRPLKCRIWEWDKSRRAKIRTCLDFRRSLHL